ncbi:F-box domain-containing protein [Favolaschia claudopus]|uniref:F-box domain-containing protein n=1 Tax=Favolaschia claudopus TaxID=2862362 RepID=A0AAW0DQG5_9AGAR
MPIVSLRLFPPYIRLTRPVRYATTQATNPVRADQKNQDVVAAFLRFIDLVKDEPKEDQPQWIRDRFQRIDLQIPSRAKIAENIVHSLFDRRLFAQAVAVYQHMLKEGLVPSPSTDALFLAMSLATSKAPGDTQLAALKTIVAYRSFTETHFIELMDHLVAVNIPADTIADLARLFTSIKGADYHPSRSFVMKLVDIQTQAGNVVAAAEILTEYRFKDENFDIPAEPYARMIKSAPADDQAAVDWIMGMMREKDVPVSILVFNAILARQNQSRDLRKAFEFYRVLLHLAQTTPLRPDAVTYKYLFRLLGHQYKTKYKPNESRRSEPPGHVTPPRQLFAEMMSLWFRTGYHPPASESISERQAQMDLDQGLLTIVFRTFLHVDDYAAALVVLRTILHLGLEVNERLYSVVLRFMSRRVYYDVHWARRQFTQPYLAFELMGPFDTAKLDEDPREVHQWIMGQLLVHNCEEVEVQGSRSVPKATSRGRVPSVSEILQQEHGLSGDKIDEYPITQMLRRALQMQFAANGMPWGDDWRVRTVQAAREEMLPSSIDTWSWPRKKV